MQKVRRSAKKKSDERKDDLCVSYEKAL